jgi:hypothetical protein
MQKLLQQKTKTKKHQNQFHERESLSRISIKC